MGKKNPIGLPVSIAAIVAAVLLAVCCVVLWGRADRERAKLTELSRAGIASAAQHLEDYSKSGEESDYRYGVADFRSFMQSYLASLDGSSDVNYLEMNRLYGFMVLSPERVQAHMAELMDILSCLSEDYTDQNGYLRMTEFNNAIGNGE